MIADIGNNGSSRRRGVVVAAAHSGRFLQQVLLQKDRPGKRRRDHDPRQQWYWPATAASILRREVHQSLVTASTQKCGGRALALEHVVSQPPEQRQRHVRKQVVI
jgi:hypothetical protein